MGVKDLAALCSISAARDQMRSQLGGAGSRWPRQHAACGLPISARGSRRRRLLLLLLAACSLLAAAVGCLLASCFSVHQRWTASRLRTPIKHPLCITSNFSNFSNFLLACQQLFPEGYGHFDRSNDLEPALRARKKCSSDHGEERQWQYQMRGSSGVAARRRASSQVQ